MWRTHAGPDCNISYDLLQQRIQPTSIRKGGERIRMQKSARHSDSVH